MASVTRQLLRSVQKSIARLDNNFSSIFFGIADLLRGVCKMSSAAFTIYHLPYGVVTVGDSSEPFLATAFGDYAINLNTLVKQGFFKSISNGSSIEQALMVSYEATKCFSTELCRPRGHTHTPTQT